MAVSTLRIMRSGAPEESRSGDAFGLAEPAKALVAVMHAGDTCQHLVRGLLGLVEFPGVDEGKHAIGRGVQLFVTIFA